MKKLISLLLVAVLGFCSPVFFSGCSTAPDQRTAAVQTLGVLGQSAKSGMDSATQLLKQGSITVAQWQKVADFYDNKWQPSYSLAVVAVKSDLSTVASPDITNLALQFLALVASLMPAPHAAYAPSSSFTSDNLASAVLQTEAVICPFCHEQGVKSTVMSTGALTTLVASGESYDENGNLMPHRNANTTTQLFHCSRGHSFTRDFASY